jgi:RNA polymerase sigma-70 factor (ECF subfamily)
MEGVKRIQPVHPGSEPDAATLDACRRGDRAALERVLTEHSADLERLLGRLVGPSGDREDLLQATFVEAIRAFPRFRGAAKVRTWLHRIAVHVVHQEWRRPGRRERVQLELVPDDVGPADTAPGPEADTHERRLLARLYGHLQAIPPQRRIPFILYAFEGHSVAEVAALIGSTQVATKSRIFWARRSLLARLQKDPVLAEIVERRNP